MKAPLNPNPNTIVRRCETDEATRARLKYQPWYFTIERQQGSHIWIANREYIMLTSNDYLGLSDHPKVTAAARRAIDVWGTSTTGARSANGSRSCHGSLEEKIAAFLGKEACHVTSAGYLSCMTAVSTLATKKDLVVVDRNVHSSLWSGIILSGARVERFAHNNPEHLAEVLLGETREQPKLAVIEGVYSMEGHIAKLPEIVRAVEGHNCCIILDDAHGFGVLGRQGQGTVGHFGLEAGVDLICGSFSKSLASTGGFIASSKAVIEYLRTHSKQTIFSAALSPGQTAAAESALQVMQEEPEHRQRLWENTRYYRQILDQLGLDYWGSETPAIPIVIGETERAYRAWKKLMDLGVFTVLAIAPGVPPGKDLLRTAISARHTREDLDRIGEALSKAVQRD